MKNKLSSRYHQAETLLQGVLSKRLALNDAVFPHWISGSNCFWYERDTREGLALGKEYRLVDANTGNNDLAFDHAALAESLEIATKQIIDPRSLPILVSQIALQPRQIYFNAFEKSWVFDAETRGCELVADSSPVGGLASPDNKHLAFVRDHNLWVRDVFTGKERPLTQDGNSYEPYAASPPFGLGNGLQALWSPDSKKLLTHKLFLSEVTCRPMISHVPEDGTVRPQLREWKAAYSGDTVVESYELLAIDIESGSVRLANYSQLSVCRWGAGFFTQEEFGWWARDSQLIYFLDVARGSGSVAVTEWDINTGVTRVLFKESNDTFVKLSQDIVERPLFYPLPESDELIWFSERSGWGHLYLYDLKTGRLKRQLSNGEWLVRDILHVDLTRRELLIQTAGRDSAANPYHRDICVLQMDTLRLMPLYVGADDSAVYTAHSSLVQARSAYLIDTAEVNGVSPDGNYLVATCSTVDTVPLSVLLDREGRQIMTLETADPYGVPADFQWPESIELIAADGHTPIYGVIYRPPGFSPEKSYPVLDFSCAHPGYFYYPSGSFVNGAYCGAPYYEGLAYAALGFVVVAIAGRGTPNRHKAFQDASYGSLVPEMAIDDAVTGLKQLAARYSYMDLNRVGVVAVDGMTGPVFGLLKYPEFYKVGVMVALEDARFIPASIAEMFEGNPPKSKTAYAETLVESLRGHLLLIHGMQDRATPVEATFRLIDALQTANKDFDMQLIPNGGHEISGYAMRLTWDYLITHLQGLEPPQYSKLTTGYELL